MWWNLIWHFCVIDVSIQEYQRISVSNVSFVSTLLSMQTCRQRQLESQDWGICPETVHLDTGSDCDQVRSCSVPNIVVLCIDMVAVCVCVLIQQRYLNMWRAGEAATPRRYYGTPVPSVYSNICVNTLHSVCLNGRAAGPRKISWR